MLNKETCPVCRGTGHAWCQKCYGVGSLIINPWESPVRHFPTCDRCHGSGRDPDIDPVCRGTGFKLPVAGNN